MDKNWNFADIIEALAAVMPATAPALLHGDHVTSWASFNQRTNALARAMINAGAKPGDKVAHFLKNSPAYIESCIAAQKARLIHVNVNYRYKGDELVYILDNSDASIVIYDCEFAPFIEEIQDKLPNIGLWIEHGSGDCLDLALKYETAIAAHSNDALNINRSGDDQIFIYTGGTTGRPKAVMWRQDDLWQALGGGSIRRGMTRPNSLSEHIENIQKNGPYGRLLAAAPFMHGAGLMTSLNALANGGAVLTLPNIRFDVGELLHEIQRHQATTLLIVGDAFARPLLQALDGGRGSIASLKLVISSGAMWSADVKQGLLKHNPGLTLFDTYGSSEGLSIGSSITSQKSPSKTAAFQIGTETRLFREDLSEIPIGSDERGLIGRGGAIPLGYYKDPEKTAKTFPVINGKRYSIPGDWGRADRNGILTLLGRGNQCINTGGEKVFPEEVEEALKSHPDILDALVFGVTDERWGQKITAVVSKDSGSKVTADRLVQHVKTLLADYKAPKAILFTQHVPRQPSGKADYASAKHLAAAYLEGENK